MMLTLKQPVHYGYRTVHDLPTPPSTSRPSPPVTTQEPVQKPLPPLPPRKSPPVKDMSAPHRGLPPPAAMTLPQPTSGPGSGPPGVHHSASGPSLHSQAPPPPPPPQVQSLGALPAPPQWQGQQGQGAEDSMRNWLLAKAEEDRRRQEEEKTRQETLRLEQRKLEHDMLRTSLDRGIPPPMVPVVFAGMSGGVLPQAALEWAQHYLLQQQPQQPQLPPAPGPLSPEDRRGSQAHAYGYAGSAGVPSTPGSGGPQSGFVSYQGPGSPTRGRAHTLTSVGGSTGRPMGSSLPRLSTNEMVPGPSIVPSHSQLAQQQQQQQAAQQETQSPSIYFHHWQPPNSQAGAAQPAPSSVDSPKKRKATGPQQAAPPPSSQIRYRSPPYVSSAGASTLSNPPPGRRRGHSRQRSDLSSYRPSGGRGRADSFGPSRAMSPNLGTPREGVPMQGDAPAHARASAHSVSSLLSDQPSPRYQHGGEASERRHSPGSADERSRGGARDRDND